MITLKSRLVKSALVLCSTALVAAIPLSISLAGQPSGAGQPNRSCEDAGVTPGQSAAAPGSAFNPDGKAGTVYAGEQPQNSVNPHSVSQYDVACYELSQH
jgi:hypothetical protein